MVGGNNYSASPFNRATQAQRQPGSTIKPIVYAAALEHGMTPASMIVDGPFCVDQGARLGQKCFRNFDNRGGAGPRTMRWGIEQSRNLMTIRAANFVGMERVNRTARLMGLGENYPNVLPVALGAADTTAQRITNAYAIMANQGRAQNSTVIDLVQDRRGRVISFGGRILKEDGMSALNSPEAIAAAQSYKQLIDDGATQPTPTSYGEAETFALFKQGKVGMVFTFPMLIPQIKKEAPNLKYEVLPIPVKTTSATYGITDTLMMFSGAKSKDEAWKVIEFLYQDKYRAAFDERADSEPAAAVVAAEEWPLLANFAADLVEQFFGRIR